MSEPAKNLFRKKPVVISASQWFKNGDHPDDYLKDHDGLENGELRVFPGAERKANGWEGDVVRYFRHPDVPDDKACEHCGNTMHVHGWIDTLEGGHIVCPGDWIITGIKGEHYPCKPDIFAATYEAVAAPAQAVEADSEPTQAMDERQAPRLLEPCPELNMANYDAVDVERLNDWAICADAEIDRLAAALSASQPVDRACPHGAAPHVECLDCAALSASPAAQEPPAAPAEWEEAQRICDLPSVDEAMRNLLDDSTGDNATCLVREVLRAASPAAAEPTDTERDAARYRAVREQIVRHGWMTKEMLRVMQDVRATYAEWDAAVDPLSASIQPAPPKEQGNG